MTRITNKIVFAFLLLINSILQSQICQANLQGLGDREGVILGFGMVIESSPFEGAEDSVLISPFPYIAYEWENAHLGVDGFSYDFFELGALELGLSLEPRWSLTDPDDSPLFEELNRDTALEAGLTATLDLGSFYISASTATDVSDVHDGSENQLSLGVEFEAGPLALDLSMGAAYKNANLNQYLYGVSDDETKFGLPVYQPSNSVHPIAQLSAQLPITENMAILIFANYEAYGNQIKQSPLISEKDKTTLGLIFLTSF